MFGFNDIPGFGNLNAGASSSIGGDLISSHYILSIASSKHGNVKARLPEKISIALSSDWKSALDNNDAAGSITAGAVQEIFGKSTTVQKFSAQIWSGNSPIELTLPLEFRAGYEPGSVSKTASSEDAYKDVIAPIKRLYKMCLPRGSTGLMEPPGPRIFNKDDTSLLSKRKDNGDSIIIKIGNFLVFQKVIVTAVSAEFDGQMSQDGFPMSARAEVTFRTMYSLVTSEVDGMLPKSSTKSSPSAIKKNSGTSLLSYAMNRARNLF